MAALSLQKPDILTVSVLFFDKFWFLASYRPSFRNRGTVSGTQTGNLENTLAYILVQNPRKIDKILPVSPVMPTPSSWIQHSVPHGKLL